MLTPFSKTLRSLMGRGVGWLLLSLAAITVLSGLLAWRAQVSLGHLQRADRINRTLPQLNRLMQDLLNAETGQRGYLLTQKGSALQPYRDAVLGLEQRLDELVQRNPDPMHGPRLERVRELALMKLSDMSQTLRLHESGRHDEALELVMGDPGHMDELRDLLGELLTDLQSERAAINARLQRDASQAELLLLGGLGTLTVFTVLAVTQVISRTRAAERSEHRLRGIADNVPALIGQFDRHGRLLFANAAAARIFGFEPETAVGKTLEGLHGAQDVALMLPQVDRVLSGERVEFDADLVVEGQLRHFHQCFVPDRGAGQPEGFYAVSMDITERRRDEVRVSRSEKRLKAVTDNLPIALAYVDAEQRLQYANETVRSWLAVNLEDALGQTLEQLLGPELYAQRRVQLALALQGERVEFDTANLELGRLRHFKSIYVPDVGAAGRVVGLYILSMDITPMKQAEAQLAQLASSDALTGLPNRRELDRALDSALARQRRHAREGRAMALLFLDVDGFKKINDSHGHSVGDEVLRAFAHCLRRTVRASDLVARLAGDEFIAVLEDLNRPDEAASVAAKIVEAVRNERMAGLSVTTSVGVATLADGEAPARDLMALADRALYQAKRAGRNGFAAQHWPGLDSRH
ncbi:diguanylate cyclase [Roseateles sp. SL47]|uniref:diguanylate cyclase domain-containing protein n=1 Tax=Roseateles sp. SL47 TaxID=2995138 RepID=UPI00227227A1|nr:diguanylate cyclase [Roseateles sp. SL47]WAC73397.1 diguanylate cyclase [Roseateles sp. SL47]